MNVWKQGTNPTLAGKKELVVDIKGRSNKKLKTHVEFVQAIARCVRGADPHANQELTIIRSTIMNKHVEEDIVD
jgi:hypothetical protein